MYPEDCKATGWNNARFKTTLAVGPDQFCGYPCERLRSLSSVKEIKLIWQCCLLFYRIQVKITHK